MNENWEVKYPGALCLWEQTFDHAASEIAASTPWQRAFGEVAHAFHAGDLRALEGGYRARGGNQDEARCRLWTALRDQVFSLPQDQWPEYARAVWNAVPEEMLADRGRLREIPSAWLSDVRRIWAFKITVVFTAGLLEGALPAVVN